MKTTLLALALLLGAANAQARDSDWTVCDNGYITLSIFEHRHRTDVAEREINFTMMYGQHILTGTNPETGDLGPIYTGTLNLDGTNEFGARTFKGTITIDFQHNKVTLFNGELNVDGYPVAKADLPLTCKRMKDDN